MNKEIEEMAKAIMNNEHIDDSILCTNHKCIRDCHCWGYEIAEALYNAGYRKTIWHKIADGDLPNDKQIVLLAWKNVNNKIFLGIEQFIAGRFLDVKQCDAIAWTELPMYEEVE